MVHLGILALVSVHAVAFAQGAPMPATRQFDVRAYGATGDGVTIDSDAINSSCAMWRNFASGTQVRCLTDS